jgi:hypothetical protein
MQKQAVPIWLADAAYIQQLSVAEDVPIWLADAARKSKISDENMLRSDLQMQQITIKLSKSEHVPFWLADAAYIHQVSVAEDVPIWLSLTANTMQQIKYGCSNLVCRHSK